MVCNSTFARAEFLPSRGGHWTAQHLNSTGDLLCPLYVDTRHRPLSQMRKERSFPDGVISETANAGFASRVAGVIEVEQQFENMPAGRIEPSAARQSVGF